MQEKKFPSCYPSHTDSALHIITYEQEDLLVPCFLYTEEDTSTGPTSPSHQTYCPSSSYTDVIAHSIKISILHLK